MNPLLFFFLWTVWALGLNCLHRYHYNEGLFRRLLREYMELRWGCRGALPPPVSPLTIRRQIALGLWKRAHIVPHLCRVGWYLWRVGCWVVEDRLYAKTGLPERWERWIKSEITK